MPVEPIARTEPLTHEPTADHRRGIARV